MSDNIYKQAAQKRLRFAMDGEVSVEQLWAAYKSKGFDLKLIALETSLEAEIEKFGASKRRGGKPKTEAQILAELRLAIVGDILDTIEEERRAELEKNKNKEILDAANAEFLRRQAAKLATISDEDLAAILQGNKPQ